MSGYNDEHENEYDLRHPTSPDTPSAVLGPSDDEVEAAHDAYIAHLPEAMRPGSRQPALMSAIRAALTAAYALRGLARQLSDKIGQLSTAEGASVSGASQAKSAALSTTAASPPPDYAELIKRAKVMADMLRMGEPIEFGLDAAIIEKQSDAIAALVAEQALFEVEFANHRKWMERALAAESRNATLTKRIEELKAGMWEIAEEKAGEIVRALLNPAEGETK